VISRTTHAVVITGEQYVRRSVWFLLVEIGVFSSLMLVADS